MNDSIINKSSIIFAFCVACLVLTVAYYLQIKDGTIKLVFCDVGQGDGAYIRLKNDIDVLIDVGPANNRMLYCLGKHMPFYDRTIEYVIISHPQADHLGGLEEIGKRYQIKQVFSLPSEKMLYPTITPRAKDKLILPDAQIIFLYPTASRLRLPVKNENDLCLMLQFSTRNTRVLFTGDAPTSVLNGISLPLWLGNTIVKVPHHGSVNSMSGRFISLAKPYVAVISVGRNNSFGHPSKKLLDLLKALHIEGRRTDTEGDIVFSL